MLHSLELEGIYRTDVGIELCSILLLHDLLFSLQIEQIEFRHTGTLRLCLKAYKPVCLFKCRNMVELKSDLDDQLAPCSALTLLVESFCPAKTVHEMTYNVSIRT